MTKVDTNEKINTFHPHNQSNSSYLTEIIPLKFVYSKDPQSESAIRLK